MGEERLLITERSQVGREGSWYLQLCLHGNRGAIVGVKLARAVFTRLVLAAREPTQPCGGQGAAAGSAFGSTGNARTGEENCGARPASPPAPLAQVVAVAVGAIARLQLVCWL